MQAWLSTLRRPRRGGESCSHSGTRSQPKWRSTLDSVEERIAEGGVVRYSGSFREEQRTELASGRGGSPSVRAWRGERMVASGEGGRVGEGGGGWTEDDEGGEGETPAGRRKAVAARSSRKDDGKYRAEQSSWRRLNKSHYKLASAGCTKLTNSLYIKTNRPSAFLTHPAPADPPTAINFRNGFSLSLSLFLPHRREDVPSKRRLQDSPHFGLRLGTRNGWYSRVGGVRARSWQAAREQRGIII